MIKMAVDVGFGRVKGVSSAGDRVDFPSVIGDFHPVKFVSGMEGDPSSNLAIEYNYKRRFVGNAALKQTTPQATVDKERTVSEEGLTLLAAAMVLMAPEKPSEQINLVVGLPVMHYETLKQKYLTAAKTLHMVDRLSLSGEPVERKYFSVVDVKVLPQPFGSLFDRLLNDRGELIEKRLAAGKVGIIDIGYNTLDLARADNLEFINPRSTSFSGLGMFTAFQALSVEIYRNLGIEIPPERIEPIIRQGEVKISGRQVSVEQFKRAAFKEAAAQIISRVKSTWPDRWELDQILITGGGAILLGEFLLSELGQQAYVAEDPVFANVAGYLKFAQRVWKQ
jgi:plasmid segregation protein ParM